MIWEISKYKDFIIDIWVIFPLYSLKRISIPVSRATFDVLDIVSVLCNAGVDAHDSTVVLNVCSSVDDFVPVAGAIGKLALGLAVGAGWDFEDGDLRPDCLAARLHREKTIAIIRRINTIMGTIIIAKRALRDKVSFEELDDDIRVTEPTI